MTDLRAPSLEPGSGDAGRHTGPRTMLATRTLAINAQSADSTGIRFTAGERYALACLATAATVAGIYLVNPHSIAHFVYYFLLWTGYIAVLHRDDTQRFALAYLINSAFIAAFYVVQTQVYPDSYGTTSPLRSWTDDSHFFSLTADEVPANLLLRDNYFLYTHTFSTLIRTLTPLPIVHPMDAIFFQSGTAALLATFSRRLAWQTSGDRRLADVVFTFTVICPFLMMNGGVILLRDTLAAALLVYSLCCLNERRYLVALAVVLLQLALRPGTGLIMLPAYLIFYYPQLRRFMHRHPALAPTLFVAVPLALVAAGMLLWDNIVALAPELFAAALFSGAGVDLLGREVIDDLVADSGANVVFLAVQDLPFPVRLVLNGAYMFLYPFLSPHAAFAGDYFDIRALALNLVTPIYAYWLNAWFIAGVITRQRIGTQQRAIVISVIVGLLLIGTYSLQTRHKTMLYPLYYIVVAFGFCRATPRERRVGYWCSSFLMLLQLAFTLR